MVLGFYIALISVFGVFAAIFSAYCVYGIAIDFPGAQCFFVLPLQISFLVVSVVFVATVIVFAVKKRFRYKRKHYIAGLAVKVFGYVVCVLGIVTVVDFLLLLRRPDTKLDYGVFNSFLFVVIILHAVIPRVTEYLRKRFGIPVGDDYSEKKAKLKSDKKTEPAPEEQPEPKSEETTESNNGRQDPSPK